MKSKRFINLAYYLVALPVALSGKLGLAADDKVCLECHGSNQQVADAASAMDLKLTAERIERLVKHPAEPGNAHTGIACVDCHPKRARSLTPRIR